MWNSNSRHSKPDRNTYGRTRAWADGLTIESPADILQLPWLGNHYSNMELFTRCDRYVRSLTDREQQKLAIQHIGSAGLGFDGPVSDEDLDVYLSIQLEDR